MYKWKVIRGITILEGPRVAAGNIRYLLRDNFTTDRAAGAVNHTNAEPGAAVRHVVDSSNKLSLSGGECIMAGPAGAPAVGDPGMWWLDTAIDRRTGRAFVCYVKGPGTLYQMHGWDANQSGQLGQHGLYFNGGGLSAFENGVSTSVSSYAANLYYRIAVVLRPVGALYLIKGNAFTEWSLLWPGFTANSATLFPGVANYDATGRIKEVAVVDLPYPWSVDYSLVTQQLTGARAIGNLFTHTANFSMEFIVDTIPNAGQYISICFRKQDTDNKWQLTIDSTGSLSLYEWVSGTPTPITASPAGRVANGHRVVLTAVGATINAYSNSVLGFTYGTATNFQTATNGHITDIGTGAAVSNLVTWPYTLTGSAPTILDMV